MLSSFSLEALAAARDAAPELPRALLLETLLPDWRDHLARLKCVALDTDHTVLTEAVVHATRAAGYRVLCYTPNDGQRVQELAGWGVDGIITDAVDRIAVDSLPPPSSLPPQPESSMSHH